MERTFQKMRLSDDECYEGEVLNGRLDGKGTYWYKKGMYIGEFKDQKIHGDGTLILNPEINELFDNREYDLREEYIGHWDNGKMNGRFIHYKVGVPYDIYCKDDSSYQAPIYYDIDSGEPLTSKDGIKCFYGGQSGFIIETWNETFVFDWYRASMPALNPDKPVYIFISHVHGDHFSSRIFSLREKYDVKEIYIGFDWVEEATRGSFDDLGDDLADLISFFDGEKYLETDFGSVRSLRSTDLGVAFLVKTKRFTLLHAGDLFFRSVMTFNAFVKQAQNLPDGKFNKSFADKMVRERFERAVPTTESIFMEYIKPLGKAGVIDYAMLPLDPRWYDCGIRTIKHYMTIGNIKCFTPMHLWEKWDYVSDLARAVPYLANKMIAVNPDNIKMLQSIELNKPYFVKL